jgi:hypothetical protein
MRIEELCRPPSSAKLAASLGLRLKGVWGRPEEAPVKATAARTHPRMQEYKTRSNERGENPIRLLTDARAWRFVDPLR